MITSATTKQEAGLDERARAETVDSLNRRTFLEPKVRVLEPGLVIVSGLLTGKEEERMAREAFTMGQAEGGFYKDGVLNAAAGRGRIYDRAERFPVYLKDVCDGAVEEARRVDPTMPEMDFTHLLINQYTTRDGLMWHRDIYENDGKSDHPVVNLTLGAACRFGWKHERADEEKSVVLESGDILLFGGPCRFILHTVHEILLDQTPAWMEHFEVPLRFSFTFRDAPEVLGREEEFRYFKFSATMKEQDEWDEARREERVALARAYQPPDFAAQHATPAA